MTLSVWKVRLGAEAADDFARILNYSTVTFGPYQAEIYKQTLRGALMALADGPNILGSVGREDILPSLRILRVARRGRRGRHFIMYRAVPGNLIDVIRILHDAMDLAGHMPSDLA